MEYQKIIDLLDNTINQSCKFKTKNWVEINNESRVTYNKDNQIRFKSFVLKSSLFDYSNAYILAQRTTTVGKETEATPNNDHEKQYLKVVRHLLTVSAE